jgi:hypothetical protein
MEDKQLTFTVGIPTCFGSRALLQTVGSIYKSAKGASFRLIIMADQTPLDVETKIILRKMGAEIYWSPEECSQMKKVNQIVEMVETDVLILTEDDVIFGNNAIEEILKAFRANPELTAAGCHVIPLKPKNFFESVMRTMMHMVNRMGRMWNKGDNYLLANSRGMAFRTDMINKFRKIDRVVNVDGYWYLENKLQGGKFAYLANANIYMRCSQNLADHIGPSNRYQYSRTELRKYFLHDIDQEYMIPKQVVIMGVFLELLTHPAEMLAYLGIYIYTRWKKQEPYLALNPIWRMDLSTKNL